MLGLWPVRPFQTELPREVGVVGKRAMARTSTGSRAKIQIGIRKVTAVPRDTPLWVMLELKTGKVPALIDTGVHFFFIRSGVAEFLYLREEPCSFSSCSVSCLLTDGQRCEVTNALKLHVQLLYFSWDNEFKF